MAALARRLAVARGDEPADLVVRGGRVLSVFTREWLEVDVAVADGFIAGLGDYEGRETLDASGRWQRMQAKKDERPRSGQQTLMRRARRRVSLARNR